MMNATLMLVMFADAAAAARRKMHPRMFNEKKVVATFIAEEKFNARDFTDI
jgi:hypothetical protein